MAKLSVIICVYNTNERYFDECLTSIFDSTLKDIEVIVVDDVDLACLVLAPDLER